MSLTLGQAPFGTDRGSFDFPVPNHVRYWEPWPRRMRAVLAGQTVLDSRRGFALHESGELPVHWYPLDDLNEEVLVPEKPDDDGAKRWSIIIGDTTASNAVTAAASARPDADGKPLDGYVTVDFAAMDHWFEEDEPVYAHVRDSYHRVDVRESSTDAAWSLPHPLPEALGAGGHICFYPDKVEIEVDGERVTA